MEYGSCSRGAYGGMSVITDKGGLLAGLYRCIIVETRSKLRMEPAEYLENFKSFAKLSLKRT